MPYNSAMTAVLKCNNCAKSDEANEQDEDDEAEDASWYIARYVAKRGLDHESNKQVQP